MESSAVAGMRGGHLSELWQLLNCPRAEQRESAGETESTMHGSLSSMTAYGEMHRVGVEREESLPVARRGVPALRSDDGVNECGTGRLRFGIEVGKGISNAASNEEALPVPWVGVTQARTPIGGWWMEDSSKQQRREMTVMTREMLPISQAGGAQVPSEEYSALKRKKEEEAEEGTEGKTSLPVRTPSAPAKEAATMRDSRRVRQPITSTIAEGDIEYILATHNYARYSVKRARGTEVRGKEGMGM